MFSLLVRRVVRGEGQPHQNFQEKGSSLKEGKLGGKSNKCLLLLFFLVSFDFLVSLVFMIQMILDYMDWYGTLSST